jgi:hypothetical protein
MNISQTLEMIGIDALETSEILNEYLKICKAVNAAKKGCSRVQPEIFQTYVEREIELSIFEKLCIITGLDQTFEIDHKDMTIFINELIECNEIFTDYRIEKLISVLTNSRYDIN